MQPTDLERLADGELRRLPLPHAPRTLLPRVMSAVDAWSRRPWYTRAWFTWPVAWQAVMVGALLALSAGVAMFAPVAPLASAAAGWTSIQAPPQVVAVARAFSVVTGTAEDLYRALVAPALPAVTAMLLLTCAACALFGAALKHVLWERALPR